MLKECDCIFTLVAFCLGQFVLAEYSMRGRFMLYYVIGATTPTTLTPS